MAVKVQTYHIRVKFLTETLGLSPASAELYEKYIKSKIYKEIEKIEKALNRKKLTEEEREALEIRLERLKKEADEEANIPELEERLTVFPRDKEGCLIKNL
jgi:NifU-like protein involved in Fe-S cluster formation